MATLRQKLWARLLHHYPLASGCGTLANHSVFQALAGRSDEMVWARTSAGRLRCSLGDYVGRAAFYVGDLDPKVSWIIRRLVNQGDHTLDIGANLGLVTLLLAERVGPQGLVHAFEPNPAIAALLEQTLENNGLSWVTLHKIGLGSSSGELSLSVPRENAGAASFRRGREGDAVVRVPVRTLASVAEAAQLSRIDFIKMDVEGFEGDVLKGAASLFETVRPRAILFELNDESVKPGDSEVIQLLDAAGYSFFAIPKCFLRIRLAPFDPHAEGDSPAHDFLAVPREDAARVARLMRC